MSEVVDSVEGYLETAASRTQLHADGSIQELGELSGDAVAVGLKGDLGAPEPSPARWSRPVLAGGGLEVAYRQGIGDHALGQGGAGILWCGEEGSGVGGTCQVVLEIFLWQEPVGVGDGHSLADEAEAVPDVVYSVPGVDSAEDGLSYLEVVQGWGVGFEC